MFDFNLIDSYELGTPCSNYSPKTFNNSFRNKASIFHIMHLNIRSASKNLDEFQVFLQSLSVDFSVIVLSETWLNSEAEWIDIPGYTSYHTIRPNRRGGGVSVLVRSNLKSSLLPDYSIQCDTFESCSVRLVLDNKICNIVGIYRPPDKSISNFNDAFFSKFAVDEIVKTDCFILGDFNVDIGNPNLSDPASVYISEFKSINFTPHISMPTRVGNSTETLIDQIWFNSLSPCESGVFPISITDHHPIFLSVPDMFSRDDMKVQIKFRCHDPESIKAFERDLSLCLPQLELHSNLDINFRCKFFCDTLFKSYDANCPIKYKHVSVKRLARPWLTKELFNCTKRKDELYRLSKIDPTFLNDYKRYRNILTSSIRIAKKQFFTRKFDSCAGDIKKTWKSINSIIRPNSGASSSCELLIDNELVTEPVEVATKFNEHYTSIASKLAAIIPVTNLNPLENIPRLPNSFVYLPTDESEIKSIISSFKSKRSDLNSIPSFIFKKVINTISSHISDLVNSSFFEGLFPDVFKTARVIPIFKSGPKNLAANYRPISTLHFLSKVFEKVFFNRFSLFFRKYDIICDQQFGFQKERSTTDALLLYLDSVYNSLNDSEYHVSVMLDFSKAFDTVHHEILLGKLERYGIRGLSLCWLRSYLSNRSQFVSVNGKDSSPLPINTGVPQGSLLGPLLFLIYINDMKNSSNILNFIHFADDTTVFLKGPTLDDIIVTFNQELTKVDNWLCSNKLSLNIDKTSFIIHSNKNRNFTTGISIRGKDLVLVKKAKFLGILIDDSLSFKDHITNICLKISRSCGIMRKLSGILPTTVLKTIYLSLVYPHLVYGIEVWGSSSKTAMARLTRLQNRSIRSIDRNINPTVMFKHHKLFPLCAIYKYFISIKFYQYHIFNRSRFFSSKILSIQTEHQRETRFKNSRCLNSPVFTKSVCFNSFLHQAIKIWNNIPLDIRDSLSPYIFKRSIKMFFLL